MIEGGRAVGAALYVYGRVTAVGSDINGETVRGTWASKGWDSTIWLVSQFEMTRKSSSYCEIHTSCSSWRIVMEQDEDVP